MFSAHAVLHLNTWNHTLMWRISGAPSNLTYNRCQSWGPVRLPATLINRCFYRQKTERSDPEQKRRIVHIPDVSHQQHGTSPRGCRSKVTGHSTQTIDHHTFPKTLRERMMMEERKGCESGTLLTANLLKCAVRRNKTPEYRYIHTGAAKTASAAQKSLQRPDCRCTKMCFQFKMSNVGVFKSIQSSKHECHCIDQTNYFCCYSGSITAGTTDDI